MGGLQVRELTANKKRTGTTIRWLPDLDVFTDIAIPWTTTDVMRRQAVVNAGVTFRLKNETAAGKFDTEEFVYEHGIVDYIAELAGDGPDRAGVLGGGAPGPGSAGQAGVQGEAQRGAVLLQPGPMCEHYHNSSWLEHGGSPEKAVRNRPLSTAPSTSICRTTTST